MFARTQTPPRYPLSGHQATPDATGSGWCRADLWPAKWILGRSPVCWGIADHAVPHQGGACRLDGAVG